MSDAALKILIIDDHRLFADGLAMIVQRLDTPTEVTICNNARTLLDSKESLTRYALVLMDLQMPNIDGFGFLTSLRVHNIGVRVLVVSSSENRSEIEKALQLGASGFVPKNAPAAEMLTGVTTVINGGRFVPEHLVGPISWPRAQYSETSIADVECVGKLTERQIQVLSLMQAGNSNIEIAQILGVSESAIKGHISRLFKLLCAKNRTACVRRAIQQNLIEA